MLNLSEEQMSALSKAVKQQVESETAKSLNEFDKTLDMVVDKLAQEGWTLPAELGIYAINVIGKTDEIADINNFLYQYYLQDNYHVAQDMIDSILSSKIKDGLKKMTTECWMAFKAKMYAVCATSLLSVIEGILSEFSDDKQDIRMMKVCQKHFNTFPADGSTIAKHVWVSYNKFIRNLYHKSDFTADEPDTINRHWLLHGRSDFEIEEQDCLRLFNAVQSLCIVVNKEAKNNQKLSESE